jgi:hypothetical protein
LSKHAKAKQNKPKSVTRKLCSVVEKVLQQVKRMLTQQVEGVPTAQEAPMRGQEVPGMNPSASAEPMGPLGVPGVSGLPPPTEEEEGVRLRSVQTFPKKLATGRQVTDPGSPEQREPARHGKTIQEPGSRYEEENNRKQKERKRSTQRISTRYASMNSLVSRRSSHFGPVGSRKGDHGKLSRLPTSNAKAEGRSSTGCRRGSAGAAGHRACDVGKGRRGDDKRREREKDLLHLGEERKCGTQSSRQRAFYDDFFISHRFFSFWLAPS